MRPQSWASPAQVHYFEAHPISATLRRQVVVLDRQRCAYCRSPMVVGIPMVVEHILPRAAGGTSMLDNATYHAFVPVRITPTAPLSFIEADRPYLGKE